MDGICWLGIVLGGLFGLGVDLWKRPLDRLLDRRLEHRTSARATMIAESLAHDRQALRDYLTEVILQTTLVGSLLGILSGIFFGVSSGISYLVSVHDFIKWRTAQGNQEGSPDDGGFHPVVRNPVHRFVLAREG